MLSNMISFINDALYSYILIILHVVGGLYFTFRTKFVQFRMIGEQVRVVGEKPADKKAVSSFQALMVSTASRVRVILSEFQLPFVLAASALFSGCG